VTENAPWPTPEDVRASFAVVESYDAQAADDPVAESERAVLGSVIQAAAAAHEASVILRPEHFAKGAHEIVFRTAMKLADDGQPVEVGTVLSELAAAGVLARVGDADLGTGGAFLHSLLQRAGSVSYHAPKVLAAWQQRNVAIVLKSCAQIAAADAFDPDVHLDEIRKRIEDATAFAGSTALRRQSETVMDVLDALEEGIDTGLSTGYADLDEAIGGMRPRDMIVIGGRPGGGKTLLGLCIADHVATDLELPVLFASLEMSNDELTQRRISSIARVPLDHIVRHKVTDDDWHRIARAQDRLTGTQLIVDETSRQSLAHIRGQLRSLERTGNAARLLVIDYLGYMAAPGAESRQQEVAALARGAKDIARDHGIPVILLAQLNRGPEHRQDKRPVPADLRESGEIEQSADIILLLHREDQYQPESARAGEIDVIVSKNRQGSQCTVALSFQGHYGCIKNLEWTPSGAGE
jgi:replicative DNA helicase